jgi:hypothetical protein
MDVLGDELLFAIKQGSLRDLTNKSTNKMMIPSVSRFLMNKNQII